MQFNCGIKQFWYNNGRGEYDNGLFETELMHNGIQYKRAPPYTQHKNGVSEGILQTLNTTVRALMIDANLHSNFRAKAVNTALYLHERIPTKALNCMMPYEKLFSKKPALEHF
jgi:hypothetical protein